VADLAADLKHLRREVGGVQPSSLSVSGALQPKRSSLKYIVPATVVLVLALIFFILKPFKIEFTPEQKAAATENSLAVMYFNNLVDADDRDKTAQMVTSLLITGLSESEYLRVVSRQRLYDILNLLGKAGVTSIDRSTASQVAEKAGVRWIVTGDIFQTQPRIVLNAEVSDAATGQIVTTQRVTGEPAEDLFAVVDKLSTAVRSHLSLPERAKTEPTRPVADVTTHSPEAYRFYLEGLDWESKLYASDARQSFQKALSFDSTFAMAYYKLAWLGGPPQERRAWIARAVKYSARATWKEQRYIRTEALVLEGSQIKAIGELQQIVERYPDEKFAYRWMSDFYRGLGQPQQAAYQLEKVVALDPMDKLAYNNLAYAYDDLGNFEKSLWAINQYISLAAPDDANPYDTRGDLYAWNGKIDEAIESYKKALQIKPGFSIVQLGILCIFKREYALAESTFHVMTGDAEKEARSQGRAYLCLIPACQGQLARALAIIEDGLAADRLERSEGQGYLDKLRMKVMLEAARGNVVAALAQLEQLERVLRKMDPRFFWPRRWQVELLTDRGDLKRAREVAEALRRDIEKKDSNLMCEYWYASGCILQAEGNIDEAIAELGRAPVQNEGFYARFKLAQAYLRQGSLDRAVTLLEKLISRYDYARALEPCKSVMCYYLLGQAYEQSGWKEKAIEKYQTFLEIWKDADPGIKEIDDARARLAGLSS